MEIQVPSEADPNSTSSAHDQDEAINTPAAQFKSVEQKM
jgi:hypothetical protein